MQQRVLSESRIINNAKELKRWLIDVGANCIGTLESGETVWELIFAHRIIDQIQKTIQ